MKMTEHNFEIYSRYEDELPREEANNLLVFYFDPVDGLAYVGTFLGAKQYIMQEIDRMNLDDPEEEFDILQSEVKSGIREPNRVEPDEIDIEKFGDQLKMIMGESVLINV